jgi:signal transduction histidine kinase
MLTIKARVILAYTILFGLVLGLFGWVIYRALRDEEMSKLRARLESHVEKLHSEIEEQATEHVFPSRAELDAIQTEGLTRARYRVLTLQGRPILDDSLLASTPVFPPATRNNLHPIRATLNLGGTDYLCLWIPLDVDERITYVLEIAAPIDRLEQELARFRLLLLTAIPLLLIGTGSAAYLITRSAFRPLTSMVDTARRITASTLHQRLEVPRARDEVQELALTFNTMIERLDTAFKAQRQFVADASHEFQTPLTVIRSELEFAQRITDNEGVNEGIAACLAEVDHLSSMAANLLTLARLDASGIQLQSVPVRLDELLVESIHLLKNAASRKDLHFDVQVARPVEIRADPARLKSAVLNVLDNAVKYSFDHNRISCSLDVTGRTAMLQVRDFGMGMDPGDISRAFQRFYQSEEARALGRGTGLGLAIVDGIVKLHGGSVSLESQKGSGTTVTLRIPLSPAEGAHT